MRKNEKKWFKILILNIFIITSFVCLKILYELPIIQKTFFYPFYYRQDIEFYCKLNSIDPLLIISIMKTESGFDKKACSKVGAKGLMQLMPQTALEIAHSINFNKFSLEMLNDPKISIKFGVLYIKSLLKEFRGNLFLALCAYNAGRGNVHNWLKINKINTNGVIELKKIPYLETYLFIKKVLKNKKNYEYFYDRH